jgi:hypothetical protein
MIFIQSCKAYVLTWLTIINLIISELYRYLSADIACTGLHRFFKFAITVVTSVNHNQQLR